MVSAGPPVSGVTRSSSLSVPAVWEPLVGDPQELAVNSEQLNARACVRCGSMMDGLMPAGQVFTPTSDGRLPWPVRACPRHTGEEKAA